MRQIGSLDSEKLATRLVDYLKTVDISAQSDNDEGRFVIWVKDENHLATAREALSELKADPDATKFIEAKAKANEIRSIEISKRIKAKKNVRPVQTSWSGPLSKRAPAVFWLMVICGAVAILGGSLPGPTWAKQWLKFANIYDMGFDGSPFYSIRQGQFWRLLTPIFLHATWSTQDLFSVLHIVFNLYWLRFLGAQIEAKVGSTRFLSLVLFTGVIPNVLQAVLDQPNFVGISGVVYGLLGYVLVRRQDGYYVDQFYTIVLLVFLVLDFTPMGMFPNVAVWCHAGGFAVGALMGYLPQLLNTR